MADIILAECGGQAWLVSGEEYIDDLLANMLPPDVTIELVACQSKSEVDELWAQHSGPPDEFYVPWLIHPAIVTRIRGGLGDYQVVFAQWSALLDDKAKATIHSAAAGAVRNPAGKVVLVQYLPPGAAAPLQGLADLRSALIEAELLGLQVPKAQISRETKDVASVPSMGEESQRVDISVTAG